MSVSIRVSPQASKVLASEARSTGSDATVILMRAKKSYKCANGNSRSSRKPSYYSLYTSKVIPFSALSSIVDVDDSVIINIVHDDGGAKAPCLIFEETMGSP